MENNIDNILAILTNNFTSIMDYKKKVEDGTMVKKGDFEDAQKRGPQKRGQTCGLRKLF